MSNNLQKLTVLNPTINRIANTQFAVVKTTTQELQPNNANSRLQTINRTQLVKLANDLTKSLTNQSFNLNSNYINNLDETTFISLATYLFRPTSVYSPPGILSLLYQDKVNPETLKNLCKQVQDRLKNIRLIRLKKLSSDEDHVEESLNFIINRVIAVIERQQNFEGLTTDLSKMKEEIDRIGKEIESHKRIIKGGGPLDFKNSLYDTSVYNLILDLVKPNSIETENNHIDGDPILNAAQNSFAGVLLAVQGNASEIQNAYGQALGLLKGYLLQVIKKYYEKKGTLSKAEIKHFRKFLSIRRGIGLSKLIRRDTASTRQFDKIITNKNNTITKKVEVEDHQLFKTDFINDNFENKFNSFIALKSELKNLVQQKRYLSIFNIINRLNEEQKKQLLAKIVFKVNGFRGTLLSHLIKEQTTIQKNQILDLHLIPEIIEKLLETIAKNHLVRKFSSQAAENLLISLKSYEVKNKYDFLIDLQHIILGIAINSKLKESEKKDLIYYLTIELEQKSSGQFGFIRIKRNQFANNLLLAATAQQSLNISSYTNSIKESSNLENNIIQTSVTNGASWGGFSLFTPASEYNSKGNTTTFTSAKYILSKQAVDYLFNLKNLDNQPLLSHSNNMNLTNANSNIPIMSQLNFKTNLEEIKQDLNEEKFEQIMDRLKDLSPQVRYVILTSKVKGDFILNKLFQALSTKNAQTTQLNTTPQFSLPNLSNLWKESANAYLLATDEELKQCLLKQNDQPFNLGQLDISAFKRYLAQEKFTTANDALIQFYHVLAMISLDENTNRKVQKLEYFAGIIHRAKNDSSSAWYALRKRDSQQELALRSLVIASTAILWGGTSAALLSSGVAAPLLIPALFLLAGIRNILYASANNLTHTNTSQYQQAAQILTFCPDLSLEQIEQITHNLNQMGNKLRDDNLEQIVNAGDNGVLFKARDTLKEYFEEAQSKVTDANFEPDKQHINKLNEYAKEAKPNLFKKVHEAVTKQIILDKATSEKLIELLKTDPILKMEFKDLWKKFDPNSSTISTEECKRLLENQEFKKYNNMEVFSYLDEMISQLSQEAVDKYSANQILFRIVKIIKLSNLSPLLKLQSLICLTYQFKERTLKISEIMSYERSFVTRNNYFFFHVLAASTSVVPTITCLPTLGLTSIYRMLIGRGTSLAGVLFLSLSISNGKKNNTKTYKKSMDFLKYALIDLLINCSKANDLDEHEKAEIEQAQEVIKHILHIPTKRWLFEKLNSSVKPYVPYIKSIKATTSIKETLQPSIA